MFSVRERDRDRERVITGYFNSWIDKDSSVVEDTFSSDAVYVESWGPAYRGKAHILAWFADWNKENTVLDWSIKAFYHTDNESICEWYFKCNCGGNVDGFNGVSVIEFDNNGKITLLKEFQSKFPNYYPYGK